MKAVHSGIAALAAALLAAACANVQPAPQQAAVKPADPRQCAQNFATEGSPVGLTGKKYTTSAFVAGVSQKIAMDRASKQIALDGLTITTLDRESGLIAASNKVIAGKGDTVPLVTAIEPAKGGVKVSMKFATGFGQVSTDDTVRDGFCRVIGAVEKK